MSATEPTPNLGPRYRPIRELGRGGFGRVLLVEDRHRQADVALKLLHDFPVDHDIASLEREFELLASIAHPGIAAAFDFGYCDELPFFTSEYIPGSRLGHRQNPPALLSSALEVVDAVAFLHESGILHLDIKPANIVVDRRAEHRTKLVDFGLFRRGTDGDLAGRVRGSLPFMAPEYFHAGRIGPWTDVFALGVTLFRTLTGRDPRPPEEIPTRDGSHLRLTPPSELCEGLPRAVDDVILRCLAEDARSRFDSAGELAGALRRATGLEEPAARRGADASSCGPVLEREREIETCMRSIASLGGGARELPAPVIVVTAPVGMGQTRLLRAVKARAQLAGVAFYLESGYEGRPSRPGSLLRCLADRVEASTARKRWLSFLERLGRPRRAGQSESSEDERRLRRDAEVALAMRGVHDSTVLAVDGLEFWDEVSIGLVVGLVRSLVALPPTERPPLGLILGYREEGACAVLLRELTDLIAGPGHGHVMSLGPLTLAGTRTLHDLVSRDAESRRTRAVQVFSETGGVPARIVALALGRSIGVSTAAPPSLDSPLGADERRVVLALITFGRPAATAEIAAAIDQPAARVRRLLTGMERRSLVESVEDSGRSRRWSVSTALGDIAAASDTERRRMHGLVAAMLADAVSGPNDPRVVEVARHEREAGHRGRAARYGKLAASYLRATYQNRAALEMERAVLEALPAHRTSARFDAVENLARLSVRLGDIDEGIELLREVRDTWTDLLDTHRARTLLWLATLHSRQGDFRRSEALFTEAFELIDRRRVRLDREQRLFFLNERASLKTFTGAHDEAIAICDEGARLAAGSRRYAVREMELCLRATRANIHARRFDYDAAIADFERSLESAEAIGSPANQAVILNNLGIVHAATDDLDRAAKAFRQAERLSLRLDEGPSLVSIYGNLAILAAKRGDVAAAEEALRRADSIGPAALGRKPALFLEHARGLCELYRGRHACAEDALQRAIELGERIGDPLLVGVDRAYRAESLVFLARHDEAARELESLTAATTPARIRKLARARLALLNGMLGDRDGVEAAVEAYHATEADRPVPFLDSWDLMLLAWAASRTGADVALVRAREAGQERPTAGIEDALAAASAFFSRHGIAPGSKLCALVHAEHALLDGDRDGAHRLLEDCQEWTGNDHTRVLEPLLVARVHLAADERDSLTRCADALLEAGDHLGDNELPELRWLHRAMLATLRGRWDIERRRIHRERRESVNELPEDVRRRFMSASHWKRWTAGFSSRSSAAGSALGPSPVRREETDTAALSRSRPMTRADLVARSPVMERINAELDRLRGSDLPVLLRGESGAGKELIARILHAESRRGEGAFVVLDCAAIPAPLLESELFGAVAGAFTDLDRERRGLVQVADGGTLFLEEVSTIPATVQRKLARVLSEGRLRRLGDEREQRVSLGVIATSSADLEEARRAGTLAEDFLQRIRGVEIEVPPLRQRIEDIPELLERALVELGIAGCRVTPDAIQRLERHDWPGNLRELRNVAARIAIDRPTTVDLTVVDAALDSGEAASVFPRGLLESEGLAELKLELERDYLYHFRRLDGDTNALSALLGITRVQLYRRCHRLGLRLREERRKLDGR